MIDPTRCTITRSPIIVNGKIVYTATMTFNVKEEVAAELVNLRDYAAMEAIDTQVKEKLHRLVWKAIYGDVIPPVMQLIVSAKRFAPSNFQEAVKRQAAICVQLLKIKLVDAEKKPDVPQDPEKN